mmetsp:Transcript_52501/g.151288  ORF Transcript_52501/g.151288 Transcript_52501/m.151288 type:complete len:215 (-) Transcript_52501:252-896(-)
MHQAPRGLEAHGMQGSTGPPLSQRVLRTVHDVQEPVVRLKLLVDLGHQRARPRPSAVHREVNGLVRGPGPRRGLIDLLVDDVFELGKAPSTRHKKLFLVNVRQVGSSRPLADDGDAVRVLLEEAKRFLPARLHTVLRTVSYVQETVLRLILLVNLRHQLARPRPSAADGKANELVRRVGCRLGLLDVLADQFLEFAAAPSTRHDEPILVDVRQI